MNYSKQTQSNPILSASGGFKSGTSFCLVSVLMVSFLRKRCKIKRNMSEGKLKTAVLGLDERGLLLLEAASQTGHFQIQAVADKDTKLAERIAAEYKCTPYDDYRQLIMQNQLDCLLVAAGMYSCDEYVRAAMKKKFNVLKLAPTARNFEEAAAFVQLAEYENIKFTVANPLLSG